MPNYTNLVNIYADSTPEAAKNMQIKLTTDNVNSINALTVDNKKSTETTINMTTTNAQIYLDTENINIVKPVSELGLVIPAANALIVTAANAAPDSTSWIGVYHIDYANWDAASVAAYTATNQGAEILRYGIYYTWEYVNGTGSGDPAADAGATVTFNFSRMLSGTYNVVMFRDGNKPEVVVSNLVQFTKA